jgi:hypothetical protein
MGIAYSPTQRLSKTAGTNTNQARQLAHLETILNDLTMS